MPDETQADAPEPLPPDQYSLLVEGAKDYAMILLDAEGRVLRWNAGAERILGWTEAEARGRPADLIFTPEDRAAGVPKRELEQAASEGRALDLRWHQRKDGSRFWADGVMEGLRDDAGRPHGFAKILRDATEQKPADDERAQAVEAARLAARRTADILESITDAFFALDGGWRFTYINAQAERLLLRSREELLGRNIWDEFPEAVGTAFAREYHRVALEGKPASFEEFYPPLAAWFEVHAYPSADGISVYFHDITTRKGIEAARDQAERALQESEARFRQMADAIPHIAWTAQPDGAVDYYNGRWYAYSGLTFEETRDWGWGAVIHPDDLARAGGVWSAALADGTVSDVEYRLRRADGEYRWHHGRSEPVCEGERIIQWVGTATDIEERKRAEMERERLLAEAQARAEREALINRVGAAIRATTDPAQVQETAAALLGEALGADRCYFSAYDHEADVVRITRDWHKPGLTSVSGEYPLARYRGYVDALYANGTAIVRDANDAALAAPVRETLTGFGLRAFLAVPLLDGGRFVAAVAASMSGGPRDWTADEAALMESVLTQTRTAAEAARVQQRERNIAAQLQEALQPPLPGAVPGLALANHYEAALAEAGVGGDFYDVFPIEKGCTALVVGDLSGKGLAAAAQVSTVRNMLRAFLYSKPTLADAVTELNRVVAGNGLLSGFATLFVGCYDGGARSLAYVNCGQEPGLLRRAATGAVEALPPTGPILGMAEDSVFEERAVALSPGDAFALFTDGLTEAGPNRREMLGVEGVAALVAGPAPVVRLEAEHMAEALARSLIAGVEAYGRGGVRDDVCLLVGVVEGGPA